MLGGLDADRRHRHRRCPAASAKGRAWRSRERRAPAPATPPPAQRRRPTRQGQREGRWQPGSWLALSLALASGCMVGPGLPPAGGRHAAAPGASCRRRGAGRREARPATTPQRRRWRVVDRLRRSAAHVADRLGGAQPTSTSSRPRRASARRARCARIAAADLWPQVGRAGSYAREHTQREHARRADALGRRFDLYQVGFDASWELDVFGGNRRAVEAAEAALEAAEYDRDAVLVTLLGEVGIDYVTYRSLQQRIAHRERERHAQQDTLGLTRRLFAAGLATELDVARAEAQVATTASTIPLFDAAGARRRCTASACCSASRRWRSRRSSPPSGRFRTGPPQVEVGIPSELLLRRPDVRARSASSRRRPREIGVATRDLFPRFFVTGFGALQSVNASDFFNWQSRAASIGPSVIVDRSSTPASSAPTSSCARAQQEHARGVSGRRAASVPGRRGRAGRVRAGAEAPRRPRQRRRRQPARRRPRAAALRPGADRLPERAAGAAQPLHLAGRARAERARRSRSTWSRSTRRSAAAGSRCRRRRRTKTLHRPLSPIDEPESTRSWQIPFRTTCLHFAFRPPFPASQCPVDPQDADAVASIPFSAGHRRTTILVWLGALMRKMLHSDRERVSCGAGDNVSVELAQGAT